jgi:glycosyltransferase involved in cell wall biosynthesis
MTKVTIVIPALNEEKAIGRVLTQAPVQKLEQQGYSVEFLVVDNGSSDKTGEIARSLGARVILEPKRGYGNAYKAGFAHADGDWIVTGDADMTYPFDMILEFLQQGERENVDFITTNRLLKENQGAMSPSHYFGNRTLSAITRVLFQWPFVDSQSGMWIFRRRIWDSLDVRSSGMPFSQEIKLEAYLRGFRCAEIPIPYRTRIGSVKLQAIRDGIRNITHLGIKFLNVHKPGARGYRHTRS